jgi:MYXO-CTERM domain-containing protein
MQVTPTDGGENPLKKLIMLAFLAVTLSPFSAKADNDRDDHPKHHIRANEMAGIGIGAAALVGVAGYFLLRRRHTT